MFLLLCLGFCGCDPAGEGRVDEQKNPFFVLGKERAAERDYKGAIEAFEKALENNPHSALAHFELGVLYEQHSDQKEEDYVAAMFHYGQAIKLRPNDYPADNARQRVGSCKRELVKAESLAPVAQNLMRELDKLKEENQSLRKQLESAQPQAVSRAPLQAKAGSNRIEAFVPLDHSSRRPTNGATMINWTSPPSPDHQRVTPLPTIASAARTHTVKAGDTPYSIARQYHLKLEALMAANPALDPKRLKVGQVVNLPST
jgi:tetratricopeptide (TPR) repeat protein